MSKTVAFIQARMSSSRFPGKVLETLDGVPLIIFMARRAARARQIDEVVVVTSTDASDDVLVQALTQASVPVFRGDLADVLRRYADAARAYEADVVVRLTGDCPLIDPKVIDAVVLARESASADYASNVDPPTFPDGLDVECFTRAVLERADREATHQPQREHVTLWMRDDAAALHRVNLCAIADLSHLRLTVDYPDDLQVVRNIVCEHDQKSFLDFFDILRIISANPEILTLNSHPRNEALAETMAISRPFSRVKP